MAAPSAIGSPRATGAALLAAAVYIAVNTATFTVLVAILSGAAREAV